VKKEFSWDKPTISEFIGIYENLPPEVGISRLSSMVGLTKSIAIEISCKNTPQKGRGKVADSVRMRMAQDGKGSMTKCMVAFATK
jgi:hypothetical protein